MVYLESIAGASPPRSPRRSTSAQRGARCAAQIAHLERELASAVIAAYPRLPAGTASISHSGPRLLGLGELERTRDDLADRIAEVREQAAARASARPRSGC